MPGLLTLRPLAAPAKSSSGATKNGTAGLGSGGGRDEARAPSGPGGVAPTFARARVPRASALLRTASAAPTRHVQQQQQQLHYLHPQQQQQAHGIETSGGGDVVVAPAPAAPPPGGAAATKLEIFRNVGRVDYSSSGSEHEPTSVCLAEMVFDYIEEDDARAGKCGRARCNCSSANACAGRDLSLRPESDDAQSGAGDVGDVLLGLIPCTTANERSIGAAVTAALKALEEEEYTVGNGGSEEKDEKKSTRTATMRRWAMSVLRTSGYNAAICKSRWEHAGGFPGGDYEYIDVLVDGERVMVDIEFRAQFEIARPTALYNALVQSLPRVFVGSPERLQRMVNIMCDAAKRSLKKKGMHLPPWRKPEYILAKWFSAYRRTTNADSSKSQGGSLFERNGGTKFGRHLAADLRLAMLDYRRTQQQQAIGVMLTAMTPSKKVEIPDVTEGKVRGAGHILGLLGQLATATARPPSAAASDVDPAKWEPPPVVLRRPSSERAAAGKVGGLVSVLKETRPPQLAGDPKSDQEVGGGGGGGGCGHTATAAAPLQSKEAAARRRTAAAGALSKQMMLTESAV